ncbi:hypothetical protein C0Q70_21041 [Pomacea canaliculata]|uniref:C2H2-type domain-containing protein n=1 Tax=Pomacea canaliculata TaxID=400727 RepID=A0A2T7NBG8_POMCA|nr:hypothetical protein C0Q70_21041 [Pomacea canaliculata]
MNFDVGCRPVPIYSRRPLQLDLSPRTLQPPPPPPAPPQQGLFVLPGARAVKGGDVSGSQCNQQLMVSQVLMTSHQELLAKALGVHPAASGKACELSAHKQGASLANPLRSPDPRGLVLYHTLLRQHPAYQHLLQSFLAPALPPMFCHPASSLCERPLAFCTSLLAGNTNMEAQKTHAHQQQQELRHHHQQHQQQHQMKGEKHSPVRSSPVSFVSKTQPACQAPFSPPTPTTSPTKDSSTTDKVPHRPAPPKRAGSVLTAEDLVSSITAVPDPYQQYGYGRKIFPCPQCRYTTDRRNNLKRHMLTMHQVSGKLLECCGVLFQTKASLREHALIFHYHGYTCFYCGRRFCRKALLKRHLSVHNGQKEFLCSVCDYATSHKSNLERHRRVHVRQDDDVTCMDQSPPACGEDLTGEEGKGHRSEDEISVCSHDDEEEDEEEINVHSD